MLLRKGYAPTHFHQRWTVLHPLHGFAPQARLEEEERQRKIAAKKAAAAAKKKK
jgi:hypothetical protein